MSVKIKELIIKAICGDKDEGVANINPSSASQESGTKLSYAQRKLIVDECTREVMDKLKRLNDY
jgi:hypothetical protein